MAVRAKFRVQKFESVLQDRYTQDPEGPTGRLKKTGTDELRTIIMSPISGNNDPDHENTKFWKASPSGEIRLGTINPGAWEQFELGKAYYIDFTEAPD